MVDPIGAKPIQTSERAGPTRAVQPLRQTDPATSETAIAARPGVRTLAKAAAEKPEVRGERVSQIKRALEQGNYPVLPHQIADHLIALRLDWLEIR